MLTLYYNDQVLDELFDVQINNDILILGTFAPWDVYDVHGYVVMDFGDDITMEFNVVEYGRIQLENMGWEIYFNIDWVE